MALFFYRDFLLVLEGKYHLIVEDRDPTEQSTDAALVEGDQRSGKELEEGGEMLLCVHPFGNGMISGFVLHKMDAVGLSVFHWERHLVGSPQFILTFVVKGREVY